MVMQGLSRVDKLVKHGRPRECLLENSLTFLLFFTR